MADTYTAVTRAFDPRANAEVETSRRTELNLREAKKAAKRAIVTRDSDGARMMLTQGRAPKLVALTAEQVERVYGIRERQAEMAKRPQPPLTRREREDLAEDMGDYSHCYGK